MWCCSSQYSTSFLSEGKKSNIKSRYNICVNMPKKTLDRHSRSYCTCGIIPKNHIFPAVSSLDSAVIRTKLSLLQNKWIFKVYWLTVSSK